MKMSADLTPEKKPRLSFEKDILERFSRENEKIQALKNALLVLSSKSVATISLTINQCNAAYGKFGKPGKPFSQADVDVETNSETLFSFKPIFSKGFSMVQSYLDNPKAVPSENHMVIILSKLLAYLLDKDELDALNSINKSGKIPECDLAVRFSQHFFSKLGISSTYTLDKSYYSNSYYKQCDCGCKTDIRNHYGDTSMGNLKIWHGSLDILLESCSLSVSVIKEKDTDFTEGKSSSIEVDVTENLEESDVTSQLVAQTIVSSFTQKKNHPEYSNFLIPTIGINRNNIIYYFYDSEHDVLLKSPSFTIFDDKKLRVFSILATWFVVNYKYLCTGLTEYMIEKVKKARFFELADCQLPVYQKDVTIGGISHEQPRVTPYQPWIMVDSDFIDE